MEPTKMNGNFYINPKFDEKQRWILTSDPYSAWDAWAVDFYYGYCYFSVTEYDLCVRAVR